MSGVGWLQAEGRREDGGAGVLSFCSCPTAPFCARTPSSPWLAEPPVFAPLGAGARRHTCPPAVFNDPARSLLAGALASHLPPVPPCTVARAVCLAERFKGLTKLPVDEGRGIHRLEMGALLLFWFLLPFISRLSSGLGKSDGWVGHRRGGTPSGLTVRVDQRRSSGVQSI